MRKRILFYLDPETSLIWSRYGSEVAVPVLDYESGSPDNNFEMDYKLEKISVVEAVAFSDFSNFTHIKAKDLPTNIKNFHRKFWGLPPKRS